MNHGLNELAKLLSLTVTDYAMLNIYSLSNARRAFLVAGLGGVSLVAATILQHVLGWQPCPLCILQRIAIMGVVLFAVLSASFSASRVVPTGSRLLASSAAVGGLYAAYEQLSLIWGQQQASCGLGLQLFLLELSDYLPALGWLLEGPADCANDANTLLGLPLAVWVVFLLVSSLVLLWLPSRTALPTKTQ